MLIIELSSPGCASALADVSSSHAAALVGSVTSQISAIHLTKQGQPSSRSSPSSSSSSPTEESLVRGAQLAG